VSNAGSTAQRVAPRLTHVVHRFRLAAGAVNDNSLCEDR